MTTIEKQRERLITLLGDLFQLNQPDLDFGFYRIMHAKADRVSSFLQNDLLKIIRDAFGEADGKRVIEARLAYEAAIKQAKEFGAPNPEETEPVKKAKAAYDAIKDAGNGEGEIYDHLFRFFERYYDNGDFMSRRYYARETDGKAAPYSVPYDGREVYLHWANRDQYYIKTSEYLTNFTFDVAKFFIAEERAALSLPNTMKLHCRIVDAAEGEHGNVKATDKTERYFLIRKDEPVKIENGELVLQFEYRPDSEKSGTGGKWQEKRLDEAEEVILKHLPNVQHWKAALTTKIGEKQDRTLLRRYLNQYTSRNTMDYFIHKDLGGFLRRELDFYIKNEIMRLDDIESADVPRVDFYLSKIKVLRKIAHHLIDFMAQLENFQKKLWLKKKFVVETNYCITLDRIPEAFYAEIAANDAQREEWVKLFAIDELKDYKMPLSNGFLKDNPFLVLDTAFFDEAFKAKLLAEMQGLDDNTAGNLFYSENFQALGLLRERLSGSVKCIYIDPPYNAKTSEILYKNTFKHSSFLTFASDRIAAAQELMTQDGIFVMAIDENETDRLAISLNNLFPTHERTCVSVIHNPRGIQGSAFSYCHEFNHFVFPKGVVLPKKHLENTKEKPLMKTGSESERPTGKNCFYPIVINRNGEVIELGEVPDESYHPHDCQIEREDGNIELWPLCSELKERKWRYKADSLKEVIDDVSVRKTRDGKWVVYLGKNKEAFKTIWSDALYNAAEYGSTLLKNIVPNGSFSFPKSLYTVKDSCLIGLTNSTSGTVLDFFAGSGTTGHAVIELNREDGGDRKYTLVEMGGYFDDVTKPRIQKVIYSKDWNEGKPVSRDGVSQCFKYIRLESYEDALNNLAFREDSTRTQALAKNDDFRRAYMLGYWLDFETKGSPSLLSVEQFSDPTAYKLKIKKPGSDEYVEKAVDLIETFNWLIGLHVDHIDAPRTFGGKFKREADPELPNDQTTRLILDGKLAEDANGKWWFRKVEGRVCRTPGDKKTMDKVLIIWRKLTGNLEEDNLMLDEWFRKYSLSTQDTEFDVIYVNGSNNLPNLKRDDENWKVRLIEESFHQKMWDVEG